jgi:predicted RNase H-like HicB family nuclease
MQIPVLIEPMAGNRFRARGPFAWTAEGATPEEALQNLRQVIEGQLNAGAQLVALEVPPPENPWLATAGMFAENPLFDEWQQAIAENRRQADADDGLP